MDVSYECEKTRRTREPAQRTRNSGGCRERGAQIHSHVETTEAVQVPLRVWMLAGVSCFAVCAALVLATVAITKWRTINPYPEQTYTESEFIPQQPHPQSEVYDSAILEKLSMFKNFVNRKDKPDLDQKHQLKPESDILFHEERRIEKKDKPFDKMDGLYDNVPEFKPTLPDFEKRFRLPDSYIAGLKKYETDYYNDDVLYPDDIYEDYVQSDSLTTYLIDRIQDLYEWIKTDPDFDLKNSTIAMHKLDDILHALNESIAEGNMSIVMLKLKDVYLGQKDNTSSTNAVLAKNATDLLSFGMLIVDVILLHNIQVMAWKNQEYSGARMLQDPEVFAFHALFLEPGAVLARRKDVMELREPPRPQGKRESLEDESAVRALSDAILEAALSSARAAFNLARAYTNTRASLKQVTRDAPHHLSRHSESHAHAIENLRNAIQDGVDENRPITELDCVWFLYCRNLVAATKLPTPFGTMARINGVALRLITGDIAAERALDTILTEAIAGWSELDCRHILPKSVALIATDTKRRRTVECSCGIK